MISYFYRARPRPLKFKPGPARVHLRSTKPGPARGPLFWPIKCIFTYSNLVMKHNTWSPWILRFKLTLIIFALNPCIKSNIFPGICRMHEQVCRFYQLSKKKCEARPARWMRKAGPARSTFRFVSPARFGPFRLGPPGRPARAGLYAEYQILVLCFTQCITSKNVERAATKDRPVTV